MVLMVYLQIQIHVQVWYVVLLALMIREIFLLAYHHLDLKMEYQFVNVYKIQEVVE
jgi:hypothetical protein